MKHRLERVKELIKRELSDLIARELRFDQLVTIQEVDITPDLKQAHVFVSVFGGDDKAARKALGQLHDKRKELQYLLSRRVILKYTPQLNFKLDLALERGTRVISILETLNVPDDEPTPEVTPAAPAAPANPELIERPGDKEHGDEIDPSSSRSEDDAK